MTAVICMMYGDFASKGNSNLVFEITSGKIEKETVEKTLEWFNLNPKPIEGKQSSVVINNRLWDIENVTSAKFIILLLHENTPSRKKIFLMNKLLEIAKDEESFEMVDYGKMRDLMKKQIQELNNSIESKKLNQTKRMLEEEQSLKGALSEEYQETTQEAKELHLYEDGDEEAGNKANKDEKGNDKKYELKFDLEVPNDGKGRDNNGGGIIGGAGMDKMFDGIGKMWKSKKCRVCVYVTAGVLAVGVLSTIVVLAIVFTKH